MLSNPALAQSLDNHLVRVFEQVHLGEIEAPMHQLTACCLSWAFMKLFIILLSSTPVRASLLKWLACMQLVRITDHSSIDEHLPRKKRTRLRAKEPA
eukprot:525394-Amphidinium_carterae.1